MSDLDTFLSRGAGEPAPEEKEQPPAPETTPEPEQPEAEPELEPEETPEPAEKPADEVPSDRVELGKALVAARKDYKEKAARLEGELTELRRQFDDMRKAPQPQPQQPPPQPEYIPNPAQDPQGFLAYQQQQRAHDEINVRLNITEYYAREKYGAAEVDAAKVEFAKAVEQNPALRQQLFQHPAPYEFVMQQVKVLRAQREIGTDPDAYRARLEAEIRERVLAEMNGQPAAPAAPRVNLPKSLATVRSAAPRSAPTYTGDTPLGDILGRR